MCSVARFVKYTGYGNAAGLLAQRGLMCGGKTGEYSSESDDSDTEEYSQLMPGSVDSTSQRTSLLIFLFTCLCGNYNFCSFLYKAVQQKYV